MIPIDIDYLSMVSDLHRNGWLDSKIESACGLSQGYIARMRNGYIRSPAYPKAARLFNFWEDEMQRVADHRTEALTS